MVQEDFAFTYRNKVCWICLNPRRIDFQRLIFKQAVGSYFRDLLKCYSDAEECGTARTVATMSIERFKSLAPAARGDALGQPMVLVSSVPAKSIPDPNRCVSHHSWKARQSYILLESS
jgi:hypothetical protein